MLYAPPIPAINTYAWAAFVVALVVGRWYGWIAGLIYYMAVQNNAHNERAFWLYTLSFFTFALAGRLSAAAR